MEDDHELTRFSRAIPASIYVADEVFRIRAHQQRQRVRAGRVIRILSRRPHSTRARIGPFARE